MDALKYTKVELLELHYNLVKPRLVEEKMLILLRQGKISKWFSGIGQEAVAVGITMAMKSQEYILPMHRNLGVFTSRNIPLQRLFSQFQGKLNGFTKGRDRSFHFGSKEYKIVGMISHLGAQLGIADGLAYANKLKKNNECVAVFTGDGGASEGDFHEAINVAAVWNLPVLFIVENNGYGLSTPSSQQFSCKNFVDKGIGYGIETLLLDGNNILEIYSKVKKIAKSVRRNPRPILIECLTFRIRGHEEASGTKYVPKELQEYWKKKDPISNFENYLIKNNFLTQEEILKVRTNIKKKIDNSWKKADAESSVTFQLKNELQDVYKQDETLISNSDTQNHSTLRLVDAISKGLKQSMEKFNNLVLMGQDIADYGGIFKITEGFLESFGANRVKNTPLCESAIIGAALGMSIRGYKTLVEMQFADFVSEGMTQICNNLAKIHYRWGQHADVVIRMPTGAGVGAGPFHSQSNEGWFTQIPGLKVVYPAFPKDAKGLICKSIEDPNPVMFFEHKELYRSINQEVPDDYYTIEIGKAKFLQEGYQATVVAYGKAIHWSLKAVQQLGLDVDVIDLRTLLPLDKVAIVKSVKKTGKLFIAQEATLFNGISGEISAIVAQECFEFLDAPIMRVGALETPVPFAKELEDNFLPIKRIEKELLRLINY